MRISDWSSDVCSSDLLRQVIHDLFAALAAGATPAAADLQALDAALAGILPHQHLTSTAQGFAWRWDETDRKSVVTGKSVSVRVDLGGRRILKKKKTDNHNIMRTTYNKQHLTKR